jgi:GT2 family glycosyltransferase
LQLCDTVHLTKITGPAAAGPEPALPEELTASVVIPVYRRAEWLAKCLAALGAQQGGGAFETIVVDDGSPNADAIAAVVAGARNAGLAVVFASKANGGPASARNHGVQLSSNGIICFLDDDSVPDPNWLQEMVSAFRKAPLTDLVNGRTRSYDREGLIPLLLEREVYPGKNWATCNIAYRRRVLVALGGFDENFPEPSWEDNDLGLRSRWAGYRHLYHELAVVYHPHENTLAEYIGKCRLNGRGAAVFSRKYLISKPWWALLVPVVMSRRLVFGLHPCVWLGKTGAPYLKFLWSLYSLQGFISRFASRKHGKN